MVPFNVPDIDPRQTQSVIIIGAGLSAIGAARFTSPGNALDRTYRIIESARRESAHGGTSSLIGHSARDSDM